MLIFVPIHCAFGVFQPHRELYPQRNVYIGAGSVRGLFEFALSRTLASAYSQEMHYRQYRLPMAEASLTVTYEANLNNNSRIEVYVGRRDDSLACPYSDDYLLRYVMTLKNGSECLS